MEEYEIKREIESFLNSFYVRMLRQFKCDCEWCKLHVQLLDNNMFEQLLKYSIDVEDYETCILIKSQLDFRKNTNYALTEKEKSGIYLKLKIFKENKNNEGINVRKRK